MKADKTLIVWLLYKSGISRYRISKATGIPQTTLSDLSAGKTTIDQMRFKNAAILTDYAMRMKEELHPGPCWRAELSLPVLPMDRRNPIIVVSFPSCN